MDKNKLIYPELSYKLQGFFFKIHNALGRFRSEKTYADTIEKIFKEENI
jgi:hypothetical protein